MNDWLTPGECQLLDALFDRSRPTANLNGPTLHALTRRGYVEITWAGRARLTHQGRELFQVQGVGA